MVRELLANQFTEELRPIFESVSARVWPGKPTNPGYFFPHVRHLMELGVMRVWEIPGAVCGALFVPNFFNGESEALVVFWFSLPETRGTLELLDSVEEAAKKAGCLRIKSASFGTLRGSAMDRLYKSRGYEAVETGFSKEL